MSVAAFVNSTGRCASMRMSTIGDSERSSTRPHPTSTRLKQRKPENGRRQPAPVLALGEREHQREQRSRQEQRPGKSTATGADGDSGTIGG